MAIWKKEIFWLVNHAERTRCIILRLSDWYISPGIPRSLLIHVGTFMLTYNPNDSYFSGRIGKAQLACIWLLLLLSLLLASHYSSTYVHVRRRSSLAWPCPWSSKGVKRSSQIHRVAKQRKKAVWGKGWQLVSRPFYVRIQSKRVRIRVSCRIVYTWFATLAGIISPVWYSHQPYQQWSYVLVTTVLVISHH